MNPKILESILGVTFLIMAAGIFTIMFQHTIPDEQQYNELRISKSSYLAYQAQYLRAEE